MAKLKKSQLKQVIKGLTLRNDPFGVVDSVKYILAAFYPECTTAPSSFVKSADKIVWKFQPRNGTDISFIRRQLTAAGKALSLTNGQKAQVEPSISKSRDRIVIDYSWSLLGQVVLRLHAELEIYIPGKAVVIIDIVDPEFTLVEDASDIDDPDPLNLIKFFRSANRKVHQELLDISYCITEQVDVVKFVKPRGEVTSLEMILRTGLNELKKSKLALILIENLQALGLKCTNPSFKIDGELWDNCWFKVKGLGIAGVVIAQDVITVTWDPDVKSWR